MKRLKHTIVIFNPLEKCTAKCFTLYHFLENWNFLVDGVPRDPPDDCDTMMHHNNVNNEPFIEDEEHKFPHKNSSAPGASILSVSDSLQLNQKCTKNSLLTSMQ